MKLILPVVAATLALAASGCAPHGYGSATYSSYYNGSGYGGYGSGGYGPYAYPGYNVGSHSSSPRYLYGRRHARRSLH